MMARLKTREAAPTIVQLQGQLDAWRKGEIDRMRAKLGTLTPQQEEAIEALTRGLVNKIAHGPITELRKQSSDPNLLDVVRRLFRLGGDE
jgi:glutamyl-tRNA reductase